MFESQVKIEPSGTAKINCGQSKGKIVLNCFASALDVIGRSSSQTDITKLLRINFVSANDHRAV